MHHPIGCSGRKIDPELTQRPRVCSVVIRIIKLFWRYGVLDKALIKSIFLSKSNEKSKHGHPCRDSISSLLGALSAVYDSYMMSPRHTLYSMEFLRECSVQRLRAYTHAPYGLLRLVLARVRQRQGTVHDAGMCGVSWECRGKPCDDTRSTLLPSKFVKVVRIDWPAPPIMRQIRRWIQLPYSLLLPFEWLEPCHFPLRECTYK